MMPSTMVAGITAKATLPAAISLIIPMVLWCSGCTKSHIFSIAVFNPSTESTIPMHNS